MLPLIVEIYDPNDDIAVEMAFTESPARIGRNPLNDVVLQKSYVSQWHALVEFDESSTRYHDLGSTNGTIYLGERVGRAPIRVGVGRVIEVGIGEVRLKILRSQAETLLMDADLTLNKLGTKRPRLFERNERAPAAAGQTTTVYDVSAAVEACEYLRPSYKRYRAAWDALLRDMKREVDALPPALRFGALDRAVHAYPELAYEREFAEYAETLGYRVPGPAGVHHAAVRAVRRFCEVYAPRNRAPSSADDIEALFTRLSLILDTFSRSFVELRKGQEEFGSEMAVRTVKERNRLSEASGVEELLRYLLDWTVANERPVKELVNAYADIMIHQVALINGLMEGARSVLRRVGPEQITRDFLHKRRGSRWTKLLARLEVIRCVLLWRHFERLHGELVEEDVALASTLFGKDFARAYAAIGDEQFDDVSRAAGPGARRALPGSGGARARGEGS